MSVSIGNRTILRQPQNASEKLPSRGQVAVLGTINGHELQTVLEPDGNSGHWLNVDERLRRTDHIGTGHSATVEIEPRKEWPGPSVPKDLGAALAAAAC